MCIGASLESVSKVRDLEIIISTVLSFNAHTNAVYYDGKSHRVLGFLSDVIVGNLMTDLAWKFCTVYSSDLCKSKGCSVGFKSS